MRIEVIFVLLWIAVGVQGVPIDSPPIGPTGMTPIGTIFAVASMVLLVGWGIRGSIEDRSDNETGDVHE